jgi:hypothetical protein
MNSYKQFLRSKINTELSSAGFQTKSGNWYMSSDEVTAVVNLQKSNYGHLYFINCGFSVREITADEYPLEEVCHVRFRATDLPGCDAKRITSLLDFDSDVTVDAAREAGLVWIVKECLVPFVRENLSLERLRDTVRECNGVPVRRSAWNILNYSA